MSQPPPADGATGAWRGLLLVSTAGVIWGTIGPGVRIVHDGSGLASLTISAYRSVVAFAVLVLVCLVTGRLVGTWSTARAHWRRVCAVGVLTALFQMLFFLAVVVAGVGVTTVVCLGFAPVLLLVLGSVRRRRPPSPGHALTVLAAVAGLVLVGLGATPLAGVGDPTPGILAALGSGAAYALSAEVAAPLTRRLDTMVTTTTTMSVAALVLVPCGLVATVVGGDPLTTGDGTSWLVIGYLGVVTMAVAYALLFTGLRSTPSGTVVVATLLEPVTAVVIAVLFLDERLTATGVVGSVLILTAIAGLGWRSRDPSPQ